MQYIQPFGNPDANASYVDRNSSSGQAGSAVPAAAIEHPMREIAAVIAAGGLTGSRTDLTQLLQAIQNLISAATGGGDTSTFVLMAQARARLPIYPHVLTSDGFIPVVSPSTGQVRVPAGIDFLHRGIFNVTTVQTDFATGANKTYHLRWSPSGGFVLKDLADVAYNAGALAETDKSFDSAFDDMLVARVTTNGSNAVTITNLINRASLADYITATATPVAGVAESLVATYNVTINWARTPAFMASNSYVFASGPTTLQGGANYVTSETFTRYVLHHVVATDWNSPAPTGSISSSLRCGIMAL